MLRIKIIACLIAALAVKHSAKGDETDTILYDFVANGLLEDSVDVLEIVAWFGRRVKDNMAQQLEEAFSILTKQQRRITPVLEHAEKLNRTDCTTDKLFQISDIIFREYFNINANCYKLSKKMSVFFNEMQNVTSHVVDIQRKYVNLVGTCEPPMKPTVDRECLQNLINKGKQEINTVRANLLALGYDIEDFMDNHAEEAMACLLPAMSEVRSATKKVAHEVQCCLSKDKECPEFDAGTYRFSHEKYVYLDLPKVKSQFDGMNFSPEEVDVNRFLEEKRLQKPYPQFGIPAPGAKPPLKQKTPSKDTSDYQRMLEEGVGENEYDQPPWRMQTNTGYDLVKEKRERENMYGGRGAGGGGAGVNFNFDDDDDDSAADDDMDDASFANLLAELRKIGQEIEAGRKEKEENNQKDEL